MILPPGQKNVLFSDDGVFLDTVTNFTDDYDESLLKTIQCRA